jgi:aspartate ammonia-lyase
MMREEEDSLGKKEIPDSAYYGVQTMRAIENFTVTGRTASPQFIRAYIYVKKAAAMANIDLGVLNKEKGLAILEATDEILDGKLSDQFPIDLFQAGAGTSFNMNINEVIANRALEILGRNKGEYDYLNPNDHVNISQSSNDTFPTASHIAIIMEADILYRVLTNFTKSLELKGDKFLSIPKSGRTHLMDAMPVTLGDEFKAYSTVINRAKNRIQERRNDLLEIAIGGTATGTGVNTPLNYRKTVIENLSEMTSLNLKPAENSYEALQSRSQMLAFSGSLRELAVDLIKIANDLRLMGSGPTSGLAEIVLPPVQPGSSIMPGKVNPVMAECLNMVSFQIIGNDTTVSLAAQSGQLELNVMTPVMISNIMESLSMLNNYIPNFQDRCIEGIEVDEERLNSIVEMNPSLITLLSPKIGYLKAAEISKESLEKKQSIRDLVIMKGILSVDEADKLFNLTNISKNRYK